MRLKWTEWLSLLGAVLFGLLVLAGAIWFGEETVAAVLEWFEKRGFWGPLLYIGLYVIAALLLVPAVIFTLGAGFVFGFWMGCLVVLASVAISAPIAFYVARFAFGERVSRKLKGHPRLKILDRGLEREGWKIVLLSRLVPGFPFKLSNYFFGLTKVSWRAFFFGTMIGVLPMTLVNVYIGSVSAHLMDITEREREPWEWGLYGLGALAAIGLVYYVARLARRAMQRVTEEE